MFRVAFLLIALSLLTFGWLSHELGVFSSISAFADEKESVAIDTLRKQLDEKQRLLTARERELADRERELKDKENALSEQVKRYESSLGLMSSKVTGLEACEKSNKEMKAKLVGLESLKDLPSRSYIHIYEKMDPKRAASIFNEMDPKLVGQILTRVKEDRAAEIMNKMEKEKVRLVTENHLAKAEVVESVKKR